MSVLELLILPRRSAVAQRLAAAGAIAAAGAALCGCSHSTAATTSARTFMPPPPTAESKLQSIPDPALRARVAGDMARMRAGATGTVQLPTHP